MFTVALVGVDGAGKTTVAKRIQQDSALPIRYVYMGANAESSNILLPTTRLAYKLKRVRGKTKPKTSLRGEVSAPPRPKGLLKRTLAHFKPYLWLVNRVAEEWFRQSVVWFYLFRGNIVLFDRHFFFDYYAYDIAHGGKGRPFPRRLHGRMLNTIFPKPDLVIFLDAPVSVLNARKREATLEYLERRREEYSQFRDCFRNFRVVDASQPEEAVVRDVLRTIEDFHQSRMKTASLPPAQVLAESKEADGGERLA